ncbi:MAG: hypothetical protein ACREEM_06800 [Blastocatellia bacterium]
MYNRGQVWRCGSSGKRVSGREHDRRFVIRATVLIALRWLRQLLIRAGLRLMTMMRYILPFRGRRSPIRQATGKGAHSAAQLHQKQGCTQQRRNSHTGFVSNRLHFRFEIRTTKSGHQREQARRPDAERLCFKQTLSQIAQIANPAQAGNRACSRKLIAAFQTIERQDIPSVTVAERQVGHHGSSNAFDIDQDRYANPRRPGVG